MVFNLCNTNSFNNSSDIIHKYLLHIQNMLFVYKYTIAVLNSNHYPGV